MRQMWNTLLMNILIKQNKYNNDKATSFFMNANNSHRIE